MTVTEAFACRRTAPAGSRGGAHHPRGGRRIAAPGAAVLRGQGLHRPAAPGREGFPPFTVAVPGAARGHRAQLPGGHRVSGPPHHRASDTGCSSGRCRRSIDAGRVADPGPEPPATGSRPARCSTRWRPGGFDAAFGGARRDEERARAKERILSFRDEFGQWDPRAQRPEPWSLYNGRIRKGEQVRVFPLSNWTELDVWRYIELEDLELPSIYFAHEREVVERDGILLAVSE